MHSGRCFFSLFQRVVPLLLMLILSYFSVSLFLFFILYFLMHICSFAIYTMESRLHTHNTIYGNSSLFRTFFPFPLLLLPGTSALLRSPSPVLLRAVRAVYSNARASSWYSRPVGRAQPEAKSKSEACWLAEEAELLWANSRTKPSGWRSLSVAEVSTITWSWAEFFALQQKKKQKFCKPMLLHRTKFELDSIYLYRTSQWLFDLNTSVTLGTVQLPLTYN